MRTFKSKRFNKRSFYWQTACRPIFTLLSILAGLLFAKVYAQCDTEVSGVLAYCNSFHNGAPVSGYFIAFRVADPTGDTLNVVDLTGQVPTNQGKRINDINTEQEPPNYSIQPLRISGVGADTLEYWYFGPFANGTPFDIALVDPNNTCDTVFVASGTFDCADAEEGNTDPFACAPPGNGLPVPLYFLDFTNTEFDVGGGGGGNENVDAVFLIMQRSREATCCDLANNNIRCIELIVRLSENDLGILIDDVGSGSTGGEIYADSLNDFTCTGNTDLTYPFQQSGGQSADYPLCLPVHLTREFIILSCKQGANVTGLSIGVISDILVPDLVVLDNCNSTFHAFNVENAFWTSEDDPHLDNFVNCNLDSTNCTFQYNPSVFGEITNCAGDTFTYIIGGNPTAADCIPSDTITYDTAQVIVYPGLSISIDSICGPTEDSVTLHAIITTSGIGCPLELLWSTGDTSSFITVPLITMEYSVTVTRSDLNLPFSACVSDAIFINSSVLCTNIADTVYTCISEPPDANTSLLIPGSCNPDYLFYTNDVSNNGLGCPGDPFIITRYYIADYDGDTINTTTDRDTCIQLLRYVDNIPPAISCPINLTITCSDEFLPPITGTASAIDNCGGPTVITFTDAIAGAGCPQEYTILRTWRATDNCGNSSSCLQTIVIMDLEPPLISCPPNVTITCSSNTLPVNTGMAIAIDNCGIPIVTFSNQVIAGQCPQEYTISRRWIASDGCSNFDTCFQLITVIDTLKPVITCPANVTITYVESTLPSNTGNATASDNCDPLVGLIYSDTIPEVTCPSDVVLYRTWMAEDACGNATSCIQQITILNYQRICGTVINDINQPIPGVELQLFADINFNQTIDAGDTLVSITFTGSNGGYCFDSLKPCDFVIAEIQPPFFGNLSDYDTSPDPDGDDSADGPDNEIPVTLDMGELDDNNNFLEILCPSFLPQLPLDTICEGGTSVFLINDLNLGGFQFTWDFGSGSSPSSGTGLGPHTIQYASTPENQSNGAIVELTISKAGCPDTTGPVSLVDINLFPDATIDVSTAPICYYANKIFKPLQPVIPGAMYQWDFGNSAVPANATGYGPHAVYYTTGGVKTAKLVIYPNEPGAQCPDSSTVSFLINICPAHILGYVENDEGDPIPEVNFRLYADANTDGMADNNTPIRSVFSTSTGAYSMASLTPGHYVIIQVQPAGWTTVDDFDSSDDGDWVVNIDSLDNLIPVSLTPLEIDSFNNYIESPTPGMVKGYVFVDFNENEMPEGDEGVEGITVCLFSDQDADGIADSSTPLYEVVTDSTGVYIFSDVLPGNYIVAETQPPGYGSIKDFDPTNDLDTVPNTDQHNDTIPLTVFNGELDDHNYFIDYPDCSLMVYNTHDEGPGSIRNALLCALQTDTITFHASLAGSTIVINSEILTIANDREIHSSLTPRISITSEIPGLFIVSDSATIIFENIDIISGLSVPGNEGAAFKIEGTVKLINVNVYRNVGLPSDQYLIRNMPAGQLILEGDCMIISD